MDWIGYRTQLLKQPCSFVGHGNIQTPSGDAEAVLTIWGNIKRLISFLIILLVKTAKVLGIRNLVVK
jgi:hypothetical protein